MLVIERAKDVSQPDTGSISRRSSWHSHRLASQRQSCTTSRRFPMRNTNPATEPVHTFHLGIWFNSPVDAHNAGCPDTVTRFNGEHNAGIQALSTRNFPDLQGPLGQLQP